MPSVWRWKNTEEKRERHCPKAHIVIDAGLIMHPFQASQLHSTQRFNLQDAWPFLVYSLLFSMYNKLMHFLSVQKFSQTLSFDIKFTNLLFYWFFHFWLNIFLLLFLLYHLLQQLPICLWEYEFFKGYGQFVAYFILIFANLASVSRVELSECRICHSVHTVI